MTRRYRDAPNALAGDERDPDDVAERIVAWVHDSLRAEARRRADRCVRCLAPASGDARSSRCSSSALARAAGVPARSRRRAAAARRPFYYHAWTEVYVGRWVAVDPMLGQFPADAAHLSFVPGPLTRPRPRRACWPGSRSPWLVP